MAWTLNDIDTIKASIATGATKVRFADGREITYRSLADMRSTLADMEREVSGPAAARPNRIIGGYLSNLS